jgi:precorrin-6B methylase 2
MAEAQSNHVSPRTCGEAAPPCVQGPNVLVRRQRTVDQTGKIRQGGGCSAWMVRGCVTAALRLLETWQMKDLGIQTSGSLVAVVRIRRGTAWLAGWLVALCLALVGTHALAQASSDRYTRSPASADGIGKRYMGREISAVMGWQGADWLEREEREREERTDLVLAGLKLKPGMVVADIGAGTGYFARRMAPAVMPGGQVLAVDVQPEMVNMLQAMVSQTKLTQIKPSLGTEQDVKLPAATVDVAIMVDVYHELAYPFEVLASVVKALKPGGRLVLVEYRAEDASVPIKTLHKMSEAQIKREATVHALAWEQTISTLPWQHMVVFRKVGS